MKKVSLSFPERPKKTDKGCCDNRRLAVAVISPPLRCNNRRGDNASPSPRPPFCPPSSSSRPRPLPPHKDSDDKCDRHRHRRSLSLPVLLPPPTPFVCRRLRCLPHICLDVSVAPDTPAAPPFPPSLVTDPTAVRLLLRYRVSDGVGVDGGGGVQRMQRRRPPTPPGQLTPLPGGRDPPQLDPRERGGRRGDGGGEYRYRDNVDAFDRHRHVVHWAEDREGDVGSSVVTEDDNDTDAEAGGYVRLGRAFWQEEDNNEDGDEQGRRAQRRRRDAVKV